MNFEGIITNSERRHPRELTSSIKRRYEKFCHEAVPGLRGRLRRSRWP